jgi:hypothetical protein
MASLAEPPAKQPRLDPRASSTAATAATATSANVIIQFTSPDGEPTGPQLDVPHTVTPQQLETLLNGLLLQQDDRLPYSFFVQDQELASELGPHLKKHTVSVESILKVVYQPQAVFRVRPVARCSATIPGHADAVLTVAFSPNGRRLASGGGDCTVRFWDLGTQTPQFQCTGHGGWVLAIAWSPDAAMLASGDRDGGVWLWDPKTGKALGQCKVRGCAMRGDSEVYPIPWCIPAHVQVICSAEKDNKPTHQTSPTHPFLSLHLTHKRIPQLHRAIASTSPLFPGNQPTWHYRADDSRRPRGMAPSECGMPSRVASFSPCHRTQQP